MKDRTGKKFHNRRGFTLAETLLALLILMMVSTIVATGIPVAKNAYEKTVLSSNAEVLLSTAVSSLRNELGTARKIAVSGTDITYYNTARRTSSKICLGNVPAGGPTTICLMRYAKVDGIGKDSNMERLISAEASTADLYVTYETVSYDESKNLIKFTNLSVKRKNGAAVLAKRESVSIRVLRY